MSNKYDTTESANILKRNMINNAFESVWYGNSQIKLTGSLIRNLSMLDRELTKANSYFEAINLLDKYKANDRQIFSLRFRLGTTIGNSSAKAQLQSSISNLESENKQLRSKIESILSTITPVSANSDNVNFTLSEDTKKIMYDLLPRFSGLRQLNNDSLANYYEMVDENGNVIPGSGLERIDKMVELVRNSYSGREAVVNACLLIFQLGANKDVKLQYRHAGTSVYECYVPVRALLSGIDCNPFASWAIDKGTPGRFMWRPVQSFPYVGTRIPYENWGSAQPGDVITTGGHVAIIVDNDPVNHRFTTAEARGQRIGIVLHTRDYSSAVADGNVVCDMTDVYNGTLDTNRHSAFPEIFNT